jgi:predicted SPOUT superfamily RNA methylase MTH1
VSIGRRGVRLSLAIPSSLVSEVPHLREKTGVIGHVGRAAAIFRVEDIYIYPDEPNESNLIRLILSYMETPQYLRRRMFRRRPELRYVGVLPPLRTPHHPVESRTSKLREGEKREGIVLDEVNGEFVVDVGVDKHLGAVGQAPSIGGRATVEITEVHPRLRGRFIGRGDVETYWGYGVHVSRRSLLSLTLAEGFDLTLATSQGGVLYQVVESDLRKWLKNSRSALIAFGSPRKGLEDVITGEGGNLEEVFHFTVNTIPEQGCKTVRTEEAIYSTLAILNLIAP